FFFQAEDGIRDRTVTGVQTCALPILAVSRAGRERSDQICPVVMIDGCADLALISVVINLRFNRHGPGRVELDSCARCRITRATRSEERRVGKECRSGLSPEY